MASCFTTWTVLPHEPIQKLSENLWVVDGSMPNPTIKRRMTIAKMKDGRLLIHNAIALGEAEMKEIEAFGTPAVLVVPGSFHRQDARIYKERYPSVKVTAPSGVRAKVEKVVPVDMGYDEAPGDDSARMRYFDGVKQREGFLEVQSDDGLRLAFTDVICNQPEKGGLSGYFMGPTGQPSVPRVSRWFTIKDKGAVAAQLTALGNTADLRGFIVAHGSNVADGAGAALKNAAALLVQ
jgi:hypothetical protein